MCALFGWLDYKGLVPKKLLKKLTQALANSAEERGTDASGISYIRDNKVVTYKRPKPAHKLKFNVPDGTVAIMGHTRLTTQGNQKFNYNNHPFPGQANKEFAFAHNGVLYNDKDLRKYKKLPDTHIETNSYIAVQLIEKQSKLDFESLKSMAEDVEGNFTFTILDENNSLHIVKGSSPMFLIHFESLGLYVYASTESIMMNALKKVGIHKFIFSEIKTFDGDIIRIDSNGVIIRSEFESYNNFKYNSWYDVYDYYDYYNEHEQILLEMCNCYGVDEDDIMLLLDYGYTAEEIENMLCDYNLITDTIKAIRREENFSDFALNV